VILLDANILIYAHASESPFHAKAAHWLSGLMDQREPVAMSWETILAFLRIVTNPRAGSNPLTISEALEIIDSLVSRSHVHVLLPADSHWGTLRELLSASHVSRDLIMDAHLAALAIGHRATLCTNDGDFIQFKGVKLFNPVA
jgi:toxin-antitoxin system PIN domain toxin